MIAIDFDGVCHARDGRRFGQPLPGTVEALEAITQEGIEVTIFTCVAATRQGREAVVKWLDKYNLPDYNVTAVKPVCDLYIDDRGMHHTDWESTIREINKRLGVEIELD